MAGALGAYGLHGLFFELGVNLVQFLFTLLTREVFDQIFLLLVGYIQDIAAAR